MNKLFALPTPSTIDMLQTVFATSMINIHWDALCVEIGSSEELISADPDSEYRAVTGPLGVWYDSATARSYLLLPLYPSPEMVARHEEIGDAWGRLFVPYMVITVDPVLRRERKAFINSVSSRFVDFPLMLTFHNETVVTDNSTVPDQQDFYADFLAKGQVPDKLFIDIENQDE